MLRPVRLVEQWTWIERGLPAGWGVTRLELAVSDPSQVDRGAALLGPLAPGRVGSRIRFAAGRGGAAAGPEAIRRLLARLDEERIEGELRLLGSDRPAEAAPAEPELAAVEQWDAGVATLPPGWSDLYAEVELTSSDHLDRAAMLCAPLNPAHFGGTPGFRFRVARRFGYGTSPEMTRRCLQRLDEDGIPAELRILRVLSDTRPAGTQGPVWYVGGRVV
jgi:hypothetical protein